MARSQFPLMRRLRQTAVSRRLALALVADFVAAGGALAHRNCFHRGMDGHPLLAHARILQPHIVGIHGRLVCRALSGRSASSHGSRFTELDRLEDLGTVAGVLHHSLCRRASVQGVVPSPRYACAGPFLVTPLAHDHSDADSGHVASQLEIRLESPFQLVLHSPSINSGRSLHGKEDVPQ